MLNSLAAAKKLTNSWETWSRKWEPLLLPLVAEQMAGADAGHDLSHVGRVVANAGSLAMQQSPEVVAAAIVLPAAWLHDCVCIAKDSPERSLASRLAAARGLEILSELDYPSRYFPAIEHCILTHSFSAGIAPETLEARIVQDADRLEAVGAIGLARCLMTGGSLGQDLCHAEEPFPIERVADDCKYCIDHFFVKLLGLHQTMLTDAGRLEAIRRTEFLKLFLNQLANELNVDLASLGK